MARLELELAYNDVIVQYVSHNARWILPHAYTYVRSYIWVWRAEKFFSLVRKVFREINWVIYMGNVSWFWIIPYLDERRTFDFPTRGSVL